MGILLSKVLLGWRLLVFVGLIRNLLSDFVNGLPSHSYLVIKFICLIFVDIP
jgi:hypothetical protein